MIRVRVFTIAVVMILLLTGIPFIFQEEAEAATRYVGPNSTYKTIASAIAAASAGDKIYVAVGTYNETVTVNKKLDLIGNSSTDCKIRANYGGTDWLSDYSSGFNITANDVNITGFNITATGQYTSGIRVNGAASNIRIDDNIISTTGAYGYGVIFRSTTNSRIVDNVIVTTGFSAKAIAHQESSNNNVIENNNMVMLSSSAYGIHLVSGWFIDILNNTITTSGVTAHCMFIDTVRDSLFENNTVSALGSSSYSFLVTDNSDRNDFIENTAITTKNGGIGFRVYTNCNDNYFVGNTINTSGNDAPALFFLSSSHGNYVMNNTIGTKGTTSYGMYLAGVDDFILYNNTIITTNVNSDGLYLEGGSNWNDIIDNDIATSGDAARGIWLNGASDNFLEGNNISTSGQQSQGIYVDNADRIIINYSTIMTANSQSFGIHLSSADSCIIFDNSVNTSGQNSYGIHVSVSRFNTIEELHVGTNGSGGHGISIFTNSNNNVVFNCTVSTYADSTHGIRIFPRAHNNTVNVSEIYTYGKSSQGIFVFTHSDNNDLISNDITTIGSNAFGIGLEGYSSECDIIGNTIKTSNINGFGMRIRNSENDFINGNIISTGLYKIGNDLSYGILLESSPNCNVSDNTINTYANFSYGIYFPSSSGSEIINNTITTMEKSSYGIYADLDSDNSLVLHNNISTNQSDAIGFYISSSYNDIIDNTVNTLFDSAHGIYLFGSQRNTIEDNSVNTNGDGASGIWLDSNSNQNDVVNNILDINGINGSGLLVIKSDENYLADNNIKLTDKFTIGIGMDTSLNTDLVSNLITAAVEEGHGIFSQASDLTNITDCIINTTGINSRGMNFEKSKNVFIEDCFVNASGQNSIGIYHLDAPGFAVNTTFIGGTDDILVGRGSNLTVLNCYFSTANSTALGGGILKVQNYLHVQVYYNDSITQVEGADIEVRDNGGVIYASTGYGGSGEQTATNGRVEFIVVTDRWYIASTSATENTTDIKAKKTVELSWEGSVNGVDMSTTHTEIIISSDIRRPPMPTGLAVNRIGSSDSVNITWNPNIDTVKYRVYTNQSGSWTQLAEVNHPSTWTNDGPLADGQWYFYRLEAWDAVNLNSTITPPLGYYLADITGPAIPSNFAGAPVVFDDKIKLSWDENVDDTVKYSIWWDNPNTGWEEVGVVDHPTNEFEFSHPDLDNGTTNEFKIQAIDEAGNPSSDSTVIDILHRDYIVPEAATNLNSVAVSEYEIELTWTASISGDVAGYNVFEVIGSGPSYSFLDSTTSLSYNHQGLLENTVHAYVVLAFDEANNPSVYSNLAENTTLAVHPDAPVLDEVPAYTNIADFLISGTAELNIDVIIYHNDANVATVNADGNGTFSKTITLTEGNNSLYARARDDALLLSTPSNSLSIKLDTQDPVANAGDDIEIMLGELALFNSSLSTDNLGIATYNWEFENGSATIISLSGMTGSYNFSFAGSYSVTLSVSDLAGNTASDFLTVKVNPKKELDRPTIVYTSPLNNATNVPVVSSVALTFSMSMNTSVMLEVLSISPSVGFDLNWLTELNDELVIDFKEDLAYNTTYTLTIGNAHSEEGGILAEAPFSLKFTTEKAPDVGPAPEPKVVITPSTELSADIEPGKVVTISGSSENISEGENVTVTINDESVNATVGSDGAWSVDIEMPDDEGEYTITVTAGEETDTFTVTIAEPEVPDDTKDTKDEEGIDQGMLVLLLALIIIIVLVVVALIVMRKKKKTVDEPEDEKSEAEEEEDEKDSDESEDAEEEEEPEAAEEEEEEEAESQEEDSEDSEDAETEAEAEEEEEEEMLEADGFEEILNMPCPKCGEGIDIPMSDDPKVSLQCMGCGAKGKIVNPYLD
jgi:parallel beta-helix repeat protein